MVECSGGNRVNTIILELLIFNFRPGSVSINVQRVMAVESDPFSIGPFPSSNYRQIRFNYPLEFREPVISSAGESQLHPAVVGGEG